MSVEAAVLLVNRQFHSGLLGPVSVENPSTWSCVLGAKKNASKL